MKEKVGISVVPRTGLPAEPLLSFSSGPRTTSERLSRSIRAVGNLIRPPKKEVFPEEDWSKLI